MNESRNDRGVEAFWNDLLRTLTSEDYIDLMMSAMCHNDPIYVAYRHYLEEKFILRKLNIDRHDSILDLGCGFGRLTFIFARLASHVEGVDFSRKYIQIANELKTKHRVSNATFTCSSALEFSPNPNGYSLIFMGGLLYNIKKDEDIVKLLTKMKTFMRPNGRFVIREPALLNNSEIAVTSDDNFRTVDEIAQLFKNVDLHLERIYEAIPVGPVFYRLAARLFPRLYNRETVFSENARPIFRLQEYFNWFLKPIANVKNVLLGHQSLIRHYFHIYAAR